jgi:uncharacterized protein YukE
MPKIQVITEEILGKSKNVNQGAADIFGSQENVTKTLQNLGKDFTGKLPTLMTEHMLAMRDKYKAMNENLTQYGSFLEHAANTYEWNESELTKWATALGGEKGASVGAAIGGTTGGASGETTNAAVTGSDNLMGFDLNSGYYPEAGSLNSFDKKYHIDCHAFAIARAKEANQTDSLTSRGSDQIPQANSMAHYVYDDKTHHYVFIERVEEVNGQTIVHFREGNWGGTPDGELKHMPLSEFESRGKDAKTGGHVAEYTHY